MVTATRWIAGALLGALGAGACGGGDGVSGGGGAGGGAAGGAGGGHLTTTARLMTAVTKVGTGTGVVTGAGIDCGHVCAVYIEPGTRVTLEAKASEGSVFTGWQADCEGDLGAPSCTYTEGEGASLRAGFSRVVAAPTCESKDVQAALDAAAAGDTVMVPAGTCTWSETVLVKNDKVTLRGAGEGKTTIRSQVDGTFLALGPPSATSSVRVTGFTFAPAEGHTATQNGSPIYVSGTCSKDGCAHVRIDHLALEGWAYVGWGDPKNNFVAFLIRFADVFGVVDHVHAKVLAHGELANVGFTSYLGVGEFGDNAWAQPDDFGTERFVVIEDSTFEVPPDGQWTLTDTDNAPAGGGRFVVRHDTLANFTIQTHGTESTGRTRGGRAYEIYENQLACSNPNGCQLVNFRSGTGMIWGNSITTPGGFLGGFVSLGAYRTFANLGGWGRCDGTGPWDDDDGQVYATGTVSAATPTSASPATVTDASQSWSPDQWKQDGAPFSVVDVTQTFGFEIGGNTKDTLTLVNANQDYFDGPPAWNVGDTIQILRAKACIDQPGRGQGDLLSGDPPTQKGWVHEVISPVYEWGDTLSGTNWGGWIGADTARIVADRDFFGQASPFDGTHGTGQGERSARPATCAKGVAFFATDERTLYQCSAKHTWTPYYRPLAYPYPLDAEGFPAAGK
jgi:hypothetical protein